MTFGPFSIRRPACGALAKNEIQRLHAVAGDLDAVGQIHFAQRAQSHVQVVGVVLDQQNFNFIS